MYFQLISVFIFILKILDDWLIWAISLDSDKVPHSNRVIFEIAQDNLVSNNIF